MLEQWAERDPIVRFHSWLLDNVNLTEDEDDEIRSEVKHVLDEALRHAESDHEPDPDSGLEGVYAEPEELDMPHFR